MAEWIWSIVLRLRLHAHTWPTHYAPAENRFVAHVHETIAHCLHGERQLALAAFLALVMSQSGHRLVIVIIVVLMLMYEVVPAYNRHL